MITSDIKKQKLNAFVTSALPVLITVLFFTNAFAKVAASIVSSLCILLFIIRLFVLKQTEYQKMAKTYYLLLLIYIAAMTISLIYTPDLGDGLIRFQGQVTKLVMVVILIEMVAGAADAGKYLYAGVAGGTVLSFMIIFQGVIKHIGRPGGIWNPVHGGILLAFSALLALALLLYDKKKTVKALCAIALIIHGYALYLNETRGAWLAFGVALLVFPFAVRNMKLRTKFVYIGVLLFLFAALLQASTVQVRLRSTIDDIKQSSVVRAETSFGGRYQMWKASTCMFLSNPIFGVGLGGWETSLREMVKQKVVTSEVLNYNQTHSIYFDVLSTRGIIGFMTFFAVIGYPVIYVWRIKDRDNEMFRSLVIIITTAFLIAGATDTLVYIRGVYMGYILLIGICLAVCMRGSALERHT